MSKPEDQLAAVAEQFKQWRQSKTHNTEAVPASLRQKVLLLAEQFGSGKIKSFLNISTSVLSRWQNQCRPSRTSDKDSATDVIQPQPKTPDFVVLPNEHSSTTNSLVVEVNINNHCQLRLSGNISSAQLDVVTRNIFMYQNGAGK